MNILALWCNKKRKLSNLLKFAFHISLLLLQDKMLQHIMLSFLLQKLLIIRLFLCQLQNLVFRRIDEMFELHNYSFGVYILNINSNLH